MNCYRMVEGYVIHRNDPGGPVAWYAALAPWHHVFKDTIYATQEMIGDAAAVSSVYHWILCFTEPIVLADQIYRTYVLWGRNWRVIALPFVLLFVSMITCSVTMMRSWA